MAVHRGGDSCLLRKYQKSVNKTILRRKKSGEATRGCGGRNTRRPKVLRHITLRSKWLPDGWDTTDWNETKIRMTPHNAMQHRYSELLPFPSLTTTLQPTSQPRLLPHSQRAGTPRGGGTDVPRMTPREPPRPGRGAHAAELEGDVAAARVVLRGLQPQRVDRHPPRLDRHCGRRPSHKHPITIHAIKSHRSKFRNTHSLLRKVFATTQKRLAGQIYELQNVKPL